MAKIIEQSGVKKSTVAPVFRDKPGVGRNTWQQAAVVARNLCYIPLKWIASYAPALTNVSLILKADPDGVPQATKPYAHVVANIGIATRHWFADLRYAMMTVDEGSYRLEHPISSPGLFTPR